MRLLACITTISGISTKFLVEMTAAANRCSTLSEAHLRILPSTDTTPDIPKPCFQLSQVYNLLTTSKLSTWNVAQISILSSNFTFPVRVMQTPPNALMVSIISKRSKSMASLALPARYCGSFAGFHANPHSTSPCISSNCGHLHVLIWPEREHPVSKKSEHGIPSL